MSRRFDEASQAWRAAVLERDGKQCVECGAKSRLHAHHIKSFSKHPELRYDVSNGVTLCIPCHAEKHPNHKRLILSVKGTAQTRQSGPRVFLLSDRHERILAKLKKNLGLTMKKTLQLALEALVEKEEARDRELGLSKEQPC